MIRRAVTQRPEAIAEVTVHLWERLARELISIIGEGGFQSLFSRSIRLTSVTFPWIMECDPPHKTAPRFAGLRISLGGRSFEEASEASIFLLITLIDILTLLIGDPLTTSILSSAWGNDALDLAGKDFH